MQYVEISLDVDFARFVGTDEVGKIKYQKADVVEYFAEMADQSLARTARKMEVPFKEYLNSLREIRATFCDGEYKLATLLLVQLAEQIDTNTKVMLEFFLYGDKEVIERFFSYFNDYVVDWYELERMLNSDNVDELGWPAATLADCENQPYLNYLRKKHGLEVEDE